MRVKEVEGRKTWGDVWEGMAWGGRILAREGITKTRKVGRHVVLYNFLQ